ncbi:hypothetical protein [Caballeronia sp. RCC_10]|uniref:hypothetical protein n=1 Tax=Caballeronia sp. RCC_10 TaxID=3239227 RepID=UPI00352634D4
MTVGKIDALRVLATMTLLVPLSGQADETIHVALRDDSIRTDAGSAKAGRVTFKVTNEANSNTAHEFVVLKTDTDEARLRVRNGQVTESRFRKIGELEDLDRRSTKRLSVTLSPGHYVLICNRPGHYEMGMHSSLIISR